MTFDMSKDEWEEGEKLARYTLRKIGFASADKVREALSRAGCKIVAQSTPINVEGEYK